MSKKATLDEKYPKGAYLEGYVYAEPVSTGEGVKGVSHSIPVLGFYGNWTDPSMYDVGSFCGVSVWNGGAASLFE